MHILQVTPYYPPAYAYGGIPRIVANLSQALVQRGHHVSTLTTDVHDSEKRDDRPKYTLDQGVRVFSVPNASNRLAYKQQLFIPLLNQSYFDAIEHTHPVDIIHIHGHRNLLNTMTIRWAKKKGIPYVFTANGTLRRHEQKQWLKIGWDALISGRVPTEASACIAVSEVDEAIHKDWGISPNKIHRIPNGIDPKEFDTPPSSSAVLEKLNIPQEAGIILYLGRISPRKGVDVLVQAFHKMRSNSHLIVAGSDMGGLVRAQRLAKKHPNIHFVGTVHGNVRLSLLGNADLVVYAGTKEIFGLVPFEGLLCGTPAIVSDDCGCGEIIKRAESGVLVPYGDVQVLSNRMDELLNSPERCRAMVDNGQNYIHQHLTIDVVSHQHIQLYEQVLQDR